MNIYPLSTDAHITRIRSITMEICTDNEEEESEYYLCLTLDYMVWYLAVFPENSGGHIPLYGFKRRMDTLMMLAELGDVLN